MAAECTRFTIQDGELFPIKCFVGLQGQPREGVLQWRFKEETHLLFLEAQTLDELIEVVIERMRYYNERRWHSSVGYLPPLAFIERVHSGREG